MTMNRAETLGIHEEINHADILGIAIDSAMVKELNRRLMSAASAKPKTPSNLSTASSIKEGNMITSAADAVVESGISSKYGHPVQEDPVQSVKVITAAISIVGQTAETAYLHAEIILEGNEYSPSIIDIGLNGSLFKGGVNKEFSNLDRDPKNVLTDFFKEVASWFTFTGTAHPVKDGLLCNLNARLKNCSGVMDLHFTEVEIFAVSIASSFQVELTSTETGKKLLVMIQAGMLGYQEADDPKEFCDSYESYDLCDLIDDHFYGELKDQICYRTKVELLKIFRDLSKLYAFRQTFSVLLSMD